MKRNEPSSCKRARPTAASRFKLPRHILVAEDDIYTLQINLEGLSEAGYKVDTAENGEVAWDALQLFRYDLVVTDNCMPGISGIELLEKMRHGQIATPVIMATAALPEVEFAAKPWLKPSAVLLKPYTVLELVAAVTKVLPAPDAMWARIMRRDRSTRHRSAISAMALSALLLSIGV